MLNWADEQMLVPFLWGRQMLKFRRDKKKKVGTRITRCSLIFQRKLIRKRQLNLEPIQSQLHRFSTPSPSSGRLCPGPGWRLVAMLSRLHLDTCSQRCNLQVLGWQERAGMGWQPPHKKNCSFLIGKIWEGNSSELSLVQVQKCLEKSGREPLEDS